MAGLRYVAFTHAFLMRHDHATAFSGAFFFTVPQDNDAEPPFYLSFNPRQASKDNFTLCHYRKFHRCLT